MEITNIGKIWSLVGFIIGIMVSVTTGCDASQSIIAGTTFGIWLMLVNTE